MLTRLQRTWDQLQSTLWFVPSLLVAGLMLLAVFFPWLDSRLPGQVAQFIALLPEAGPEGARELLGTIGGSMLTVASVAFSFTIVVFSFASAQYSSRTLRIFMDDNTNQVVLGMLLGSFVYCTIVLRTVPLEASDRVPALSITFALLLGVVCLGLFIIYIHHNAEAIQAYHIIERIARQTHPAINHLFPAHVGVDAPDDGSIVAQQRAGKGVAVLARRTGYIQAVDGAFLMDIVTRHDLFVTLEKSVGNFVVDGETLAHISPGARATANILGEIEYAFIVGKVRTVFQDPLYGIMQLSDIAVKALSPAINDPNTAIMSLNHIGAVLRQAATTRFPTLERCDKGGHVRVIAYGPSFGTMVAQGFDQVRRHAILDAAVPLKMLDVLGEIAEEVQDPSYLAVLRDQTIAVAESCDRNIPAPRDRMLINKKLVGLHQLLQLPDHVMLTENVTGG